MQKIISLAFILYTASLYSQDIHGSIVCASSSIASPFTVGEIYIEGSTGLLGTYSFISNQSVSVVDIDEMDEYLVWPNPACSSFSITQKRGKAIASIKVMDAMARTVASYTDAAENDISALPTGTYFLWVNGKVIVKLIKE